MPADVNVSRPVVQHSTRGQSFVGARVISAILVICLILVLVLFFSSDAFYVRSIAVGGNQFLSAEEVFALTDIANLHIFWVDPDVVRESVMASTSIADATVTLGWPPNVVEVLIVERQPAMIWIQEGVTYWIDLQGRVMPFREARPELMQVIADADVNEGPLSDSGRVSVNIVNGALQLRDLLPGVNQLRYHPVYGLGFTDERGTDVWFGTGANMSEKIIVYQAIVADLQRRGLIVTRISVANLDAPYFCPLGAPCDE